MNVRQVVPRDAIPSIDDPEFGPEYFGDSEDEVIVVESSDRVRAYPVRILDYHEIVNDELGGDAIAVTWCPLCASAVVYDREVDASALEFGVSASEASEGPNDSLVLSFGVSGKLADDDLVMYDRETESEWKQSLGEAIAGELEGESLSVRPSVVTTYRRFREEYPDGVVLQRPGGESEASGPGDEPEPIDYDDAPYADYFESDGFGLAAHRGEDGRKWSREDLDPKAAVLGIEREADALGFPLPRIERAGGVAHASVGGREVVTFATDDGIHAFENPGFEFEATGDDSFEADGATWDATTGESDDGRRLERVPVRRLFAFAWQDDHGPDSFWSVE